MTHKREPFPSTSLGRSFQPPPEVIVDHAHPLTSYVAYKAKPRPALGSAEVPELTEFRTTATALGVSPDSVGWIILQQLATQTSPEWAELNNLLTASASRWILLLPSQTHDGNIEIGVDLVREHVVFLVGKQFLTLSGLRGIITDSQSFLIRSSISPASQIFRTLLINPTTKLPVLPLLDAKTTSYPKLTPSSLTPISITLPPRPSTAGFPFTTIPESTTPRIPVSPSRLPNPFANLFGGTRDGRTPIGTPGTPSTPTVSLGTPTPVKEKEKEPVRLVSAILVDNVIVLQNVARDVNSALRDEIHTTFAVSLATRTDFTPPKWVTEELLRFVGRLVPFVKKPKPRQAPGTPLDSQFLKQQKELLEQTYVVNPFEETPDELSELVQQFFMDTADRLMTSKPHSRVQSEDADEFTATPAIEAEARGQDIHNILSALEKTITELFYDRLFIPPLSDDSSHDEALSSRVAALNMLDLGLEHLDIIVSSDRDQPDPPAPAVMSGGEKKAWQKELARRAELRRQDKEEKTAAIDVIIRVCGDHLSSLDSQESRSPASKVRILVEAHKMIVDGLGQIPGLVIRLKSDKEIEEGVKQREKEKMHVGLVSSDDLDGLLLEKDLETKEQEQVKQTEDKTDLGLKLDQDTPVDVEGVIFSAGTYSDVFSPPHNFSVFSPLPVVAEAPVVTPEQHIAIATSIPLPSSRPPTPPAKEEYQESKHSASPAPISGDVLFPLIVFSVVKSNPPSLISHLLFSQRFRIPNYSDDSSGGEESYCLTNLLAVAEFLENVDMEALGLQGAAGRVSTVDLTPIPIPALNPQIAGPYSGNPSQQTRPGAGLLNLNLNGASSFVAFDSLASGAGKVFNGVVDSSFGMLRSWLPGQGPDTPAAVMTPGAQAAAPWNNPNHVPEEQIAIVNPNYPISTSEDADADAASRIASALMSPKSPGFGLLRRSTSYLGGGGMHLVGMLPQITIGGAPKDEIKDKELVEVPSSSRAASLKSVAAESSSQESEQDENDDPTKRSDDTTESSDEGSEGSSSEEEDSSAEGKDTQSIRSFSRMISPSRSKKTKPKPQPLSLKSPLSEGAGASRKSLTDRLAKVGSTLASKAKAAGKSSPAPSLKGLGAGLPPPNPRFTTLCNADASDLTIAEVGELLTEYRRLVDSVQKLSLGATAREGLPSHS